MNTNDNSYAVIDYAGLSKNQDHNDFCSFLGVKEQCFEMTVSVEQSYTTATHLLMRNLLKIITNCQERGIGNIAVGNLSLPLSFLPTTYSIISGKNLWLGILVSLLKQVKNVVIGMGGDGRVGLLGSGSLTGSYLASTLASELRYFAISDHRISRAYGLAENIYRATGLSVSINSNSYDLRSTEIVISTQPTRHLIGRYKMRPGALLIDLAGEHESWRDLHPQIGVIQAGLYDGITIELQGQEYLTQCYRLQAALATTILGLEHRPAFEDPLWQGQQELLNGMKITAKINYETVSETLLVMGEVEHLFQGNLSAVQQLQVMENQRKWLKNGIN